SAQGKTRKPEIGTLFLRKPGRMRWQYTAPAGKLFLSDGKFVYVVVPDSPRVQKMKAKETDDMRAPLAFLLGRLHFEKDFQNFQSRTEGEDTWVTADAKKPDLIFSKLEFEVTPQFQIRRLRVTYQDLSVLDFRFDQEKRNPPLDAKVFQFELPSGAMVEEIVNYPMADFVLKYADARGEIHQQTASAGSENEVRERYSQQGFLIYSIRPRRTGIAAGGGILGRS